MPRLRPILKTAGLATIVYLFAVPAVYTLTGGFSDAFRISRGAEVVTAIAAQVLLWAVAHFFVGHVAGCRAPSARMMSSLASGFVFAAFYLGFTVAMDRVVASAFGSDMPTADWNWSLLMYAAIVVVGMAISSLGGWASARRR